MKIWWWGVSNQEWNEYTYNTYILYMFIMYLAILLSFLNKAISVFSGVSYLLQAWSHIIWKLLYEFWIFLILNICSFLIIVKERTVQSFGEYVSMLFKGNSPVSWKREDTSEGRGRRDSDERE